jgi:glycosyltransferase involved in cell wall biosynthesis
MKRALVILSAPQMFGFMRGQSNRLSSIGYKTTVLASSSAQLDELSHSEAVERLTVDIPRCISPARDLRALWEICMIMRRLSPDLVLLSGPKAIFLGGMASWLCGVPKRIAVYHGMRQETLRPPLLWLIDFCDRVSFACASKILAVSPSLRELVIKRGLVGANKIGVTGHGTANGVDTKRFALTPASVARAAKLKQELMIPGNAPVIGYVGRLTEDKGIADAYAAFCQLREAHPSVHLVLIGQNEMHSIEGDCLLERMRGDSQVRIVGHVNDVVSYLHIMWAQVFPSAREGFGMAIAEASALGVPTVAYDVTGVRDAIVDGETGALVPHGSIESLVSALAAYLKSNELRKRHGSAGMLRVRELYSPDRTWNAYLEAIDFKAPEQYSVSSKCILDEENEALGIREKILR